MLQCNSGTNHVMRRSSSNSLNTFTDTWLLVVTLMTGPGKSPLIAITCNQNLIKLMIISYMRKKVNFTKNKKKKEKLGHIQVFNYREKVTKF